MIWKDGEIDIVLCTWEDNVYAIDNLVPLNQDLFTSTNRFNCQLVDIDSDGDLEIVVVI